MAFTSFDTGIPFPNSGYNLLSSIYIDFVSPMLEINTNEDALAIKKQRKSFELLSKGLSFIPFANWLRAARLKRKSGQTSKLRMKWKLTFKQLIQKNGKEKGLWNKK